MKGLINSIPRADGARRQIESSDHYKEAIEKAIRDQNEMILKAVSENRSSVCFYYQNHEYAEDIKKMYYEKGYSFKRTGCRGGVIQKTIDICW